MSRRRHPTQPFDYPPRYSESSKDRDRDQPRGIEYQDDSLSPINSDDESYLPRVSKNKGGDPYFKMTKPEKAPNEIYGKDNRFGKDQKFSVSDFNKKMDFTEQSSQYHHKDGKESGETKERLNRLETMLEKLIQRKLDEPPPVHSGGNNSKIIEKISSQEREETAFSLEPRRRSFTTSMWLTKIQEVSLMNNWSEKSTIQYLESQMTGIIKAWYNNLQNKNYSWPEWKLLISKTFPDNYDFVITLKRLVTRLKRSDESMTDYYFSKMYLIESCKISGEDAVSCLIDGLNNEEIQRQAKAQNFLTPETLYSQYLTTLPDYNVDYSPPMCGSNTTNYYPELEERRSPARQFEFETPGTSSADFDEDRYAHSQQNLDGPQTVFEPPPISAPKPLLPPPLLKRSGTVHSRLDKKFLTMKRHREKSRQPLAMRVCTICSNRGHLAKHCRSQKKSFWAHLKGRNFNKETLKTCTLNGIQMGCLLDTGCDSIALKQSQAERLQLTIHRHPSKQILMGLGGSTVQSLGCATVTLEIDTVKQEVEILILPDWAQPFPLIVGTQYFNKPNIYLIFSNKKISILDMSKSRSVVK